MPMVWVIQHVDVLLPGPDAITKRDSAGPLQARLLVLDNACQAAFRRVFLHLLAFFL